MEQRTIRLNFDVSFVYGPRTWRAPLVAAILLCAVGDLNSESVTLSTYYPAPSGVYTNMITTGNTFLARDGGAGTKVGIGVMNPGGKLAVAGSMSVGVAYAATVPLANALIVGGRVGIGTPTPTQALEVVNGNVRIVPWNCGGPVNPNPNTGSSAVGGAPAFLETVCAPNEYATFTPGIYVEGWSMQYLGGSVQAESTAGAVTTQVRGLNPATGAEEWMTLKQDNAQTRIWCCPRNTP